MRSRWRPPRTRRQKRWLQRVTCGFLVIVVFFTLYSAFSTLVSPKFGRHAPLYPNANIPQIKFQHELPKPHVERGLGLQQFIEPSETPVAVNVPAQDAFELAAPTNSTPGGNLEASSSEDGTVETAPQERSGENEVESSAEATEIVGAEEAQVAAGDGSSSEVTEVDVLSKSAAVFYSHVNDVEACVNNLSFYVEMLARLFRADLLSDAKSPSKEIVRRVAHVFILSEDCSSCEDFKARLNSMRFPSGHELHFLTQPACDQGNSIGVNTCGVNLFQWQGFELFVLVDSTTRGPFLSKWWAGAGLEFWFDAYTTRLTPHVGMVGGKLICALERGKAIPRFQHGPLAFSVESFRMLLNRNFDVSSGDLLRLMLLQGYNFEALHGQAEGIDWREWVGREEAICTMVVETCNWPDWKGRYPHLAHMPLSLAQKKFMKSEPPEGVGCGNKCDYEAYGRKYPDLRGMGWEELREHYILYGSLEGRDCSGAISSAVLPVKYDVHPYETLFLPSASLQPSISVSRYSEWSGHLNRRHLEPKNHRSVLAKNGQRILVVFAYYEKNALYRANLLFFIETAIVPDSVSPQGSHVDYIIVVNGETTVEFPELWNLKVIRRDNTCFDFGSWGIGLTERQEQHYYFFLLNSSVRGPFLPTYFRQHWTEAMLALVNQDTHLVGLAINCPDGMGRLIPHVMTMAMAFTRDALQVGMQNSIFDCSKSYVTAVRREGRWSHIVLRKGLNSNSMQAKYVGVDWRSFYRELRESPREDVISVNKEGFNKCKDIDLDIFYSDGWYAGLTPHPVEFVFYKTNRNIGTWNTKALTHNVLSSSRNPDLVRKLPESTPDTILVLTHSLDVDGAPRMLYHLTVEMIKLGYRVVVASPQRGVLGPKWRDNGAITVFRADFGWHSMTELFLLYQPTVLFYNTITFCDAIEGLPHVRSSLPKVVWMLHENEIVPKSSMPNGFWYGKDYPVLNAPDDRRNLIRKVDHVVFVADAVRSLWSPSDFGGFITFRCFVRVEEVLDRAGLLQHAPLKEMVSNLDTTKPALSDLQTTIVEARQKPTKLNHKRKDDFVITSSGTYCARKRQLWLVEAVHKLRETFPNVKLLLLGKPSVSGGRGEREYAKMIETKVEELGLTDVVELISFSQRALEHVVTSQLHVSASSHEAFPLNTLEAMLVGTPVAMTPAGGSEEQLQRPGYDGFLFPSTLESSAQLEAELHRIVEMNAEDLKEVGRRGQLNVLQRFTDLSARERVDDVMKTILPVQKPPGVGQKVCLVLRPPKGPILDALAPLERSLRSLQQQEMQDWVAFVMVEQAALSGVFSLLSHLDDMRFHVRVASEEEGETNDPAAFLRHVVEQCPWDSTWLMLPAPSAYLHQALFTMLDDDFDGLTFGHHSRDESDAKSCENLLKAPPDCAQSGVASSSSSNNDAGAFLLNLRRWRLEERTLTLHDGALAPIVQELEEQQWQFKQIGDPRKSTCLLHVGATFSACMGAIQDSFWRADTATCVDALEAERLRAVGFTSGAQAGTEEMQAFQNRCLEAPAS